MFGEKKKIALAGFISVLWILLGYQNLRAQENRLQYVDPFIGTDGQGHTFPGATLPFGMVQLSPDNGPAGQDEPGGYAYSKSHIIGFSHMHLSGSPRSDWQDISVMPLREPLEQGLSLDPVSFSHTQEKASPGYYMVQLDNGIRAELTASAHVGFHQYSFPAQSQPVLRLDMQFHGEEDVPTHTLIKKLNDSTVVGYRYSRGWAPVQRVYFAARTSEAFEAFYLNGEIQIEGGDMELGLSTEEAGEGAVAQLVFKQSENAHLIRLKVALSMTGMDQALENLNEIPHWDFNQVRSEAEQAWQSELQKVAINSTDIHLKRNFYTALYHTAIAPNLYSDPDGSYQNARGDTLQMSDGGKRYTTLMPGENYNALYPLFTLIQGARYGDMLKSIMSFYQQQGVLPSREVATNETDSMGIAYAIPVLADAVLKQWPGLDQQAAYTAMKKMLDLPGASMYSRLGYLPRDKTAASVSKTLENGFIDYSLARTAGLLDDSVSYQHHIKRARAYQHVFDKVSGFMRGRDSKGNLSSPFYPAQILRRQEQSDYLEGNAWENSFYVPHDVRGLSLLFGGDSLEQKIDALFEVKTPAGQTAGHRIGQYNHANSMAQLIPYLYNYLGKAWKTQEKVRMIADTLYKDQPQGYASAELFGQQSAWLVWTAIGMYPVNPVGGEFVIGSPLVDQATLVVGKGKKLKIEVRNNAKDHPYIQSLTFNGKPYDKTYFRYEDLIQGGTIVFTMGEDANREWGQNPSTWPTSLSPNPEENTREVKASKKIKVLEKVKDFFNKL